jgi:hypothetical protein
MAEASMTDRKLNAPLENESATDKVWRRLQDLERRMEALDGEHRRESVSEARFAAVELWVEELAFTLSGALDGDPNAEKRISDARRSVRSNVTAMVKLTGQMQLMDAIDDEVDQLARRVMARISAAGLARQGRR